MIKKESIENLKENIDIVDVVGSYIELRKNGGSFKARCPFHDEKTPSFVVNQNKQFFHCFGCGKSGNSISFVMEYEGLSFRESVEELADRFSVELEYENSTGEKKRVDEENLLPFMQRVSEWFESNLQKNGDALQYLYGRGFDKETISKFQIGYAPSSYESLNFFQQENISLKVAEELGLVAKDSERNSYYARFSNRVIFPIFSQNGKIIAFGGRTLSNHPAKYINSPATRYFNKSKVLYGYNFAKEQIFREKKIIVVEGYLDLIALHQAGIKNVVATLGTALTEEHLPLLKRDGLDVVLAFDGDKAGIDAGRKASEILLPNSIDISVVLFPDGKDPADLLKSRNSSNIDEVKEILSKGVNGVKFVIHQIANKFNLENPMQKERAGKEIGTFLSTLSSLLQDEYRLYSAVEVLGSSVENRFIVSPDKKMTSISQGNPLKYIAEHKHRYKENPVDNIIAEKTRLSLLKSAIEYRECLTVLKSEIEERYFKNFGHIYRDILQEKIDSPELLKLSLREDIPTLKPSNFKLELLTYKLYILLEKRVEAIETKNFTEIRFVNMEIPRTEREIIKAKKFKIEETTI